jgi:hypothetical protein
VTYDCRSASFVKLAAVFLSSRDLLDGWNALLSYFFGTSGLFILEISTQKGIPLVGKKGIQGGSQVAFSDSAFVLWSVFQSTRGEHCPVGLEGLQES